MDNDVPCCKPVYWAYLGICFSLVSVAGISSGLALGLLSFSQVDLEALPIFLDSILPEWMAIVASVTLVLAFAEILPQAVCSRHGLSLGAKLSGLVRFLLLILYPVAYPTSKLLDWMLGKGHSALLRRAELKTLVGFHSNEAGKGGELSSYETTIISGALDLTLKTAKDAMTPLSESFSLDIDSKLDMHTMGLIRSMGHSRVPIYSGSQKNVIGVLLVKNLIFCRPEDETPIKYMTIRKIPRIHEDCPLYGILKEFQKGHSHMALVDVKIDVETAVEESAATNLDSKSAQEESRGIRLPLDQKEQLNISTNTSPLYASHMERQIPAFKSVMAQQKDLRPHGKNWEGNDANIAVEDFEIPGTSLDEEVIGIITMEDVMEELLQNQNQPSTFKKINRSADPDPPHMAANDVPCCEPMFWTYLVICVALVSFAGLMSGLTLGLMSLSLVDLEVLIKAGQPQDRKNAEKILPIVKNQHLLLCTLLIGNAMAMEALPIFLDAILPAWGAILISVTLILAFGEIIPQAVCSRYGLSVGAKLSVVVRLIVIVFFPIAYPISKLLDWILGKKHSALLRRAELKTLVDLHGNEAGKGGELTHDETTIITGALDMIQKTAKDAMTPISNIFSLDINSKLDEKTMGLIISKGHSRVPIYSGNPTNIIGLILVKNLIKFRPEDETPIKDLTIRRIPRVHDRLPLYDILNQFQKGQSHMAVVVKSKDDVEHAGAQPDVLKININVPITKPKEEARKGSKIQLHKSEQLKSPSIYSSETGIQSPAPKNVRVPADYLHREVIGVITLEDVMEELLQEEIWDETDEYVDVHNKIKINMLPSRRSPMRSPGLASPHIQWGTPVASPLCSCHQSPLSSLNHTPTLLHSPIPQYNHSPFIRPTFSASPAKSAPSSPGLLGGCTNYSSPSAHRVSRKA
ncbi:hypothetical protein Tsubulata_036244 [Turnera subulata]|uniref:CNNM transmembrane domain-containing protein n=1 Tax=Turnera subulata TaxID=218843 RepID=A0A9Q0JAJ9_9ROSI|nr:hypothetical protein Tsubulata_036244 [Turnera subulata]